MSPFTPPEGLALDYVEPFDPYEDSPEPSEWDRLLVALWMAERKDEFLAAKTAVDAMVDRFDLNARAYGWEIGHGTPYGTEQVTAHPDNPFITEETINAER